MDHSRFRQNFRPRSTSLYGLADYGYASRNRTFSYGEEEAPLRRYSRRNDYFYENYAKYSTDYNYPYLQMASLVEKSSKSKGSDNNCQLSNGVVNESNHHHHHHHHHHKEINERFHDDLPFATILREKISNNDTTPYIASDSEHSWLYDVDLFREKIKNQHFHEITANSLSNANGIYNDSSENFSYMPNDKLQQEADYSDYSHNNVRQPNGDALDNKFQTRSESEPNNISDLRYSPSTIKISNNIVNEHRSKVGNKKLPPTPPKHSSKMRNGNEHMLEAYDQDHLISSKIDNKKISPPKLLIYNNSQTPRSPKTRKSLANFRPSSRIASAPRTLLSKNEFRRCRTKSPSPTFSRNLAKRFECDDSDINFKSMRKAKSETPPPVPRTFEQFTNTVLSMPKSETLVPFSHNKNVHSQQSTQQNQLNLDKTSSNFSPRIFNLSTDRKQTTKYDNQFNDDIEYKDDEESCYDDEEYELSENDDDYIESSSDSEDGYQGHAFSRSDQSDSPILLPDSQATNKIPNTPESVLAPSLFPNVPPYISFATNLEKGPAVPPELHKVLKWKLSKVMPKVVRYTLMNSGCRVLKKTNEWMGTWGKHMKSPCFRTVRPYQKMNHLPGSFKIGRKDSCWKNLQKQVNRHGKKEFGFMPKTYIFPNDINILRKTWPKYQQRNIRWIIKPPASARGTGIKVVFAWSQIPKRKPLIVQRYIERPLLINGSKFDIRLYVLVTSINPLRVYMYKDGLARFASVKYSTKAETLHDRCMHLTNYSINKHSTNYAKNEDVNACEGHKWTLKSLMTYLSNTGIDVSLLWITMKNLVLRTLLAGEEGINNMVRINTGSRYNTYELFGFDILLDSNLVPWLLEVNISPSLHSDLPLDMHVKGPLVQAVLNTALYHVPPKLSSEKQKEICQKTGVKGPLCYDKRLYVTYLSRAEKIKHNQFIRKDLEDRDEYLDAILENLTPDDVRCLITAEDELARCLPLERVFPTHKTYKLLKYTDSPRYYNRLLDAWEHRYSSNRNAGISLLRELCESNYHLQVPQAPTQRDSSDDKTVNNSNIVNIINSNNNNNNNNNHSNIRNNNTGVVGKEEMDKQEQQQRNEIYVLGTGKGCKEENPKKECIDAGTAAELNSRTSKGAKKANSSKCAKLQSTKAAATKWRSANSQRIDGVSGGGAGSSRSVSILSLTSVATSMDAKVKNGKKSATIYNFQSNRQRHRTDPIIVRSKVTKTSS